MARQKKDGKRATGIQGKRGYLYIVLTHTDIRDGKKKSVNEWISTGLKDKPENYKKASEQRRKLLNNHSSSDNTNDKNTLVPDYIDYFLERKKREVADTTYSGYLYCGNRVKSFYKESKLKEINKQYVEDFLDYLFTEYDMMPRTVKDTKRFFSSVMHLAAEEGLVPYNPVKEATMNKTLIQEHSTDEDPDDNFLSYEEAHRLLIIVEDHPLYEVFYITLFFGIRREEVLGLKWSAIDFENKTIKIVHTVTRGTKVNRFNSTKTETSKREYPLTDEQIGMFLHLKKAEDENRKLCGNNYIENDYIFKHADGSPFYPDYPSKELRKIIKNNPDLPQRTNFRSLRRSCVSILVHQGMDVKSIQKWVGHKDIDTTLRTYAKVKDKEAKKEISTGLSDIIKLKKYDND